MPSFAKKFNFTQAESAEEQYMELIQSSTRKAAVSTAEAGLSELKTEYSTYKAGSADQSSEWIDLSTSSGSTKHPRDPFDDDNAVQTKPPRNRAPPLPTPIPPEAAPMNERHMSQDNEDEDEDKVGNDEDVEYNDDHPNAERPTRPASFDQDPALSTTSNEAIHSPKRTTLSTPLGPFETSHKAGALSTHPSVTGAPLADAGKPGFRGMPTDSCKASKPAAPSFLGPDTGRHEPQASTVSHQLSASAMEPEEPGPSASSVSHRSRTSSVESGDLGPHTFSASNKMLPGVASSLAPSAATTPEDLYGQLASGISTEKNQGQSRRVSFGRVLTVEDLSDHHGAAPTADDFYSTPGSTPPFYSPRQYLGADLLSSDPADLSFVDNEDLKLSTSRLYTWDCLDGPGRVDSDVDNFWVCNGIEVGGDLMACRSRIVENNGGLAEPYEKLIVNFAFLVEAEYQTGGLQGEVEDDTWDAICETVRDPVLPLSNEAVTEAHQWAHRLAQNKSEAFAQSLDDSPPQNRTLKSILTKMADTAQLWSTRSRNEDTYLKCQLGPFLDTYFGKLKHTKSDWTPVQDETRGAESNLLIPDYAITTQVGKQQISVLLLEGKIARNTGQGQIWDDLTKLGHEMKAALDSIVQLQPEGDVAVISVLVREPLVDFYTMRIHAEATYIMHRFATTYIAPEAMNVFPLVHLMEIFEHIQGKVQQTVTQIRQVKVHPSPSPKVPLSWLRPSFKKPRRCQIVDGQ
ncbi:hypothetical protein BGW39_001375 [Mortierella sp. 14UC]|nr:hypothetical protein BGW39_001375 [Mortierella sp. 14UC]